MGKRGPKPGQSSDKNVPVSLKMPGTMKARLIKLVNQRKVQDPSLPLNWGLSEYIREVLALHLQRLPDDAE